MNCLKAKHYNLIGEKEYFHRECAFNNRFLFSLIKIQINNQAHIILHEVVIILHEILL